MRTFPQVLRENAVYADKAVTFVRATGAERRVPFPELWQEACRRGAALRALGLKRGDRVALVLPEPDEFVLTFMAALCAGIVAVPMYPPQTLAKMEAYGDTVRHILEASGARVLVTNESLRPMLAEHQSDDNVLIVVESDIRGEDQPHEEPPHVSLDDLAFLQFTSGSTSRPKGVMVTFGNLAANAQAIMVDGLKSTPEDRGVSWLPLYHDMGLIGFVVAPLYTLVQVMFLPTMSFIRRPSVWLDAIHRFRGTITFAPNFAYALAARAVTDTQSQQWDLSCMRALGCGAEPIQASVLRGFLDRFAAQGLRPTSVLPSYGMAEATLAVSFHELGTPMRTERVDAAQMRKGKAVPANGKDSMEIVSCGRAFLGHEIKVCGPDKSELPARMLGELWVRGPSVTPGYFRNSEATQESFEDGWLKTGDLGYLDESANAFICGRAKDLIILNGKNYYPQDIEAVVSKCSAIRDGQCVAFSKLDSDGAEVAVVVAEAKLGPRAGTAAEVVAQVIQLVRSEIGILLSEVHLIKRGTLPKTSSGKVRRREAKRRLELMELDLLSEAEADSVFPPPPSEAQPHVSASRALLGTELLGTLRHAGKSGGLGQEASDGI